MSLQPTVFSYQQEYEGRTAAVLRVPNRGQTLRPSLSASSNAGRRLVTRGPDYDGETDS
jgi:hypothetical protein